jgi:hypothetical protein
MLETRALRFDTAQRGFALSGLLSIQLELSVGSQNGFRTGTSRETEERKKDGKDSGLRHR